MSLPGERAQGPPNGTSYYHGDFTSRGLRMDSANAPNNISEQSPHPSSDALAPSDRHERRLDPNGEAEPRHRAKRRPSGQQRICGKCQKSLTGQFVRALGDTYHLECFTCNVCSLSVSLHRLCVRLTRSLGLRQDCRLKILPSTRSSTESISTLRDRLLPAAGPPLLRLWRCSARILHHCAGSQVSYRTLHVQCMSDSIWRIRQLLRA